MAMIDVPAGTTEQMVGVSTGIELRVLRSGTGPAIVMAPGWTCSADFFNNQLAGLAADNEVIAYALADRVAQTSRSLATTSPNAVLISQRCWTHLI